MRLRLILVVVFCCAFGPAALAHHVRYTGYLTGAAESPANASPGLGHVVLTIDFDQNMLEVDTTFDELLGTVTQAHIHAPAAAVGAGVAGAATMVPTFDEFPAGATSGNYTREFDLALASTYNPAFITSSGGTISTAYQALTLALDDGKAYFDIHTTAFPDGEIRGFLSYVAGDYNDNGVADAADYVLWRSTLGITGEGLKADSNNDNVIDGNDYAAWRANIGRTGLSTPASFRVATAAIVPEPSSLVAVAFAILAHLHARQRR